MITVNIINEVIKKSEKINVKNIIKTLKLGKFYFVFCDK